MAKSTKFDAADAAYAVMDQCRTAHHHLTRAAKELGYAARSLRAAGLHSPASHLEDERLVINTILTVSAEAHGDAKRAYRRALKQECCGQKMEARGHGFECLLCGTVMSGDSGS